MSDAATKRYYRSPTREESVEVSLSDFNDDELREEMTARGLVLGGRTAVVELDLARLYTLRLCGQKAAAEAEALQQLWEAVNAAMQ